MKAVMRRFLNKWMLDILLISGCICILVGLAQWSMIATWIVGGLMLLGFAFMIAAYKVKNAD